MIKRSTALALLAAVAVLGAGCGKDSEKGDPIPASLASTLEQRLQVIQSQIDQGGGACTDITDRTEPVVRRDLDRIPSSVDPDVRDALVASFDHLFDLASSQCQDTTTETTPTETDTTPTETQDTQTQTETQQTETQQTQPQQTQTQELPPGQQKKQNGNGNNGNGNGGGPAAPGQ
jgi:cobalamin biosynthesis Mg chelatase CobN